MTAEKPPTTPDSDLVRLGQRLRQLRRAADMTQQELADAALITRVTLIRAEAGETSLGARHLYALARALKVEPSDLFQAPG